MMKYTMHPHHRAGDADREGKAERGERERLLDSVAWAIFFIWVGASWLAGLESGYVLLGIGIVTLLAQAVRRLVGLRLEGFWLLIGCGFFAAGYWELWNVGVPLAPIVLIGAGIGLLAWQFLGRRHKR